MDATVGAVYIRRAMHELRWVRDHPEEFDRGLVRRGLPPRAEELLTLDRNWRAAETRMQEAQARRNRLAREVGAAKKRGEAVDELMRQSGADRDREAEMEAGGEASRLRAAIDEILGRPAEPAGRGRARRAGRERQSAVAAARRAAAV